MIETGKLLEEEANTAGAKEWSFLSRNSEKAGRSGASGPARAGGGRGAVCGLGGLRPTLKRVLLHVNFVELIGSDEDTVVGEVDTAAGL